MRDGRRGALQEISKRQPVLKNRVASEAEAAVVELAIDEPRCRVCAANELAKGAQLISAADVRCVWVRHDLQTLKLRLRALEAKVAQEGRILPESEVAALERALKLSPHCSSTGRGTRSSVNTVTTRRRRYRSKGLAK